MLQKGQSLLDEQQEQRPSLKQSSQQNIQSDKEQTPSKPRHKLIAISTLLIFFYVLLVITNISSRKNSLIIKEIADEHFQEDEINKEYTKDQLQNEDQKIHQKLMQKEQPTINDHVKLESEKQKANRLHQDTFRQIVQWSTSIPNNWNSKKSKITPSGQPLILRGYQQTKQNKIQHDSQQFNKLVNEIQLERSNKKLIETHQKLVDIYHQIRDDINYNIFSPTQENLIHAIDEHLKIKPIHKQLKLLQDNNRLDLTLSKEQNQYFKRLNQKYSLESRKNHQLCILVSTHNNAQNKQIHRTLYSIFNQDYDKYQVIIANYQSNDATIPLIHTFIEQDQSIKNRTTFLSYETQSQPEAVWHAAKYCKSDSFIVYLDGNIELLGKNVFKVIDSQITPSKSIFLYSDYYSYDYQTGAIKYERTSDYDESETFLMLFRKLPNKFGKLAIFKTDSLKSMPTQRFSFNGIYFMYTGLDSIFYTLLQTSCGKSKSISQPLFFILKDSSREKRIKQQKKHQLYLISDKLRTDIC